MRGRMRPRHMGAGPLVGLWLVLLWIMFIVLLVEHM